MRRGRVLGFIAVTGILGVLVGSRWLAPSQPELRAVLNGSGSVSLSNVPYDAPRSVGGFLVCLTAPGTATITGVAIHDPSGGIRVEAFAVRPNPYTRGQVGLGDEPRTLAAYGRGFDPAKAQEVSGRCPTDAEMTDDAVASKLSEIGVELGFSSGDVAGGNSLDVRYRIGGDERTALIPFGIWLCAATCPEDRMTWPGRQG